MHHKFLTLIAIAISLSTICLAAEEGLVASWTFSEGQGDVIGDVSGNGNDGRIHGAQWVPQGDGFALFLDGDDDYVDCGEGPSLNLTDAVTVAAWIKPAAVPAAEPIVVGKSFDSYGLSMYKDGKCWWYISGGGNNLKASVEVGKWNYLVGTFDGEYMELWINHRRVGRKKSLADTIDPGGRLLMGTRSDLPNIRWRGEIDEVRIYNRALPGDEIQARYKDTAAAHAIDTTWFDRLRLTTSHFHEQHRMDVVIDTGGVFPLPPNAALKVDLGSAGQEPLQSQQFDTVASGARLVATFQMADLPAADYTIVATLTGDDGSSTTAQQSLRHPAPDLTVPAPADQVVAALPATPPPPDYNLRVHPGGGFSLEAAGRTVNVVSSYSYPNGGENLLAAAPVDDSGQEAWEVQVQEGADDAWTVTARGDHYSLRRRIRRAGHRILVEDTLRNETDEVLGVILENRIETPGAEFDKTWSGGFPSSRSRKHPYSPSAFASWPDLGVGVLPQDDVYIIHATCRADQRAVGVMDDEFGLAAGASYTLEWAVYLNATGDYYDFINQVRKDENRYVTVEGGFAFIPRDATELSDDYVRMRGLRYASIGCLTHVADDPEIEIEGIEFLELPKERARLKSQFDSIRATHPDLKFMFHIAHSLWSTNKPSEIFPDSRVIDAAGNHVTYPYNYGNGAYFSQRRHEEGWRWYIYYPTPGNSFHDALLSSADVLLNDIGATGTFMDGYLYGYGSRYAYDRWDGHTVQIDPETKTVRSQAGSVLVMAQPSIVEFTKRMLAGGATVIANGAVMTRTIRSLPILVDLEINEGPGVHLAPTSACLGNPAVSDTEEGIYGDVLAKLKWGNLYFYYGECALTYPSLPQQMYPITVEQLHEGAIIGRERLITMNPGVYGWPGDASLHYGYRYNCVGRRASAQFLTTVDASGVRTQVELGTDESAVLKKVPVSLRVADPVNLWLGKYDVEGIALTITGSGQAELLIGDGDFRIETGRSYHISAGEERVIKCGADNVLHVPLKLDGQLQVAIAPAGDSPDA